MHTLLIQVLTLGALTLVHLAYDYQVDGYGLTPVIAFPVATLMIGVPLIWEFVTWSLATEDEFEHVVLERAHCGNCGQYKDLVNGRCVPNC